MGGENWLWEGTKLYPLYDKQDGDPDARFTQTGREGGVMLRRMLVADKRTFRSRLDMKFKSYVYSWTGEEDNSGN